MAEQVLGPSLVAEPVISMTVLAGKLDSWKSWKRSPLTPLTRLTGSSGLLDISSLAAGLP